MTSTITLTGGLDVGNGYEKGLIRGTDRTFDEIDIPSGVTVVTRSSQVPTPDADAVEVCGGDFYNELDASFISPLVDNQYRHLFGRRGLSARGAFEEFDVIGSRSKAEQSLSKVLVLGSFAAKALRDYVRVNGSLPAAGGALAVTARVALALPITEFMKHRRTYAAAFTADTHTVTIHNFDTPVTVKITFEDVEVIAEGASAQYAINDKGVPLMEGMLADLRTRGIALDGVTAQDVLSVHGTVGVDIGEGTVNFPVFTDGSFNVDSSATFAKGYGTALTNALDSMDNQSMSMGFTSRKQLANFLQTQPSALKRSQYQRVSEFVDEEIIFFAREVADQLGRVLSVVGPSTEVIYVYGGGSGPVKEILYPALLKKVKEMTGLDDGIPVLYLDASYSRNLNREGLYIAAEALERLRKKPSRKS